MLFYQNGKAAPSLDTIDLLHDAMTTGETLEVAGEPVIATSLVSLFYQSRDFKPAWADLTYAASVVELLGRSNEEGLFPADYHYNALVRILNSLNEHPDSSQLRAHLDLLLTDGILLYPAQYSSTGFTRKQAVANEF